jgi:hypothetical protein
VQRADRPVYDVESAPTKADDFDDVGKERVLMQNVTEMVVKLDIRPETASVCLIVRYKRRIASLSLDARLAKYEVQRCAINR